MKPHRWSWSATAWPACARSRSCSSSRRTCTTSPCSAPSRTGTTTASCCRRCWPATRTSTTSCSNRAPGMPSTASPCMPATRWCASTAAARRARAPAWKRLTTACCWRPAPRPSSCRCRATPAGVVGFRDMHDVDTMLAAARQGGHAVVIGGGLLGLEAANGLMRRGMDVTVVHVADSLMNQQLDEAGRAAAARGAGSARACLPARGADRKEIVGTGKVEAVRSKDGSELRPTWW
jgi:hypothetical protein